MKQRKEKKIISMKHAIKTWLSNKGVYSYLKYSWYFKIYQSIFKQHEIRQHKKEVGLYRSFIPKPKLIFDIGAFDGHKTAAFLALGSKVVSCEPDPKNFGLLQTRFRKNKNRVFLENAAVADQVGKATFFVHHEASAFNTLNPDWTTVLENDQQKRWDEKITFSPANKIEVDCTTLDILIEKYGLPDFIKIDVEGYEKQVFEGLSQKVPCVSFECTLPEFSSHIAFISAKLLAFEPATFFNVVYNETLIFKHFITYNKLEEWLKNCDIYSFDIVAKADF